MKVTYYGHSCFLIETAGYSLLFDPFLSANPLAKDLNWKDLAPDYVLVSHGHYDHMLDAAYFLREKKATLICNFEIGNWFLQQGDFLVHKMNIGAKLNLPFGQLRMTAAYHSSTLPDGSSGGSAGGFIVRNESCNFYFAGDTGLGPYLDYIGEHWAPKVVFLPISGKVVLDAEDAYLASKALKCDEVIGMHHNAFEELKIDEQAAKEIFQKGNKTLTLLLAGETKTY